MKPDYIHILNPTFAIKFTWQKLCGPDIEVVQRRATLIRAARAALHGLLLGVLINYVWHSRVTEELQIPAMAVSPLLFQVGADLCKRNEGLRRIEITLPVSDKYTFICKNGAHFADVVSLVK